MSGRVKSRQSANPMDHATLTVNEKILRECHNLYIDQDKGLINIAEQFGLKLLAPRKKIIVLLIGNHSAGKSSFINWYIEEHVQKTGVAIETQGFVIVTSGKKRESLMGNATLHLYPHFKPLQKISGVVDFLSTEISTSKQKKFSLVTFVDTPGLVDGDMQYPFDVNEAILWLGDMADLVFVFFDPIGQALCKRTLTLVEKLNSTHAERMRFYLSKADEAGNESDRQRVMMQIVQELCKRPGLNRTGFDMPTIYIPTLNKVGPEPVTFGHKIMKRLMQISLQQGSRCVNQVEDVCKDIERTINQTVQNTLNALERDCEKIAVLVDEKLAVDDAARDYNFKTSGRAMVLIGVAAIFPLMLILYFLATCVPYSLMHSIFGKSGTEQLYSYMFPAKQIWSLIPDSHQWTAMLFLMLLFVVLILSVKWSLGLKPTLSRKHKRNFVEIRDYVQNVVKNKKQVLYREYLEQSVADHDL